MRRKFVVVALAASAIAAVFVLPASAASKSTDVARANGVRAFAKSALKAGVAAPQQVNIAWTAGALMPVAVEETGGGSAASTSFYVAGGYKTFGPPPTLNNTVQSYVKTTNTWTNNTLDPIPTVPGLVPGLADAGQCYDPVGGKVHIMDGVAYDATGAGFIIAEHLVYDPAAPAGSRMSFLSIPIDSLGNIWYGQDQGCSFIGGKMYLYGGYGVIGSNPAQIEKATWVYDPATDTWSDTGKLMIGQRLWMGYGSNTTTAFAAGGTNNLATFAPQNTVEKFTPAGGWVAQPNLPTALLAPGMGYLAGHEMVWGGGDSTFTPQNKTYHCKNGTCGAWQTTAFNLPTAKWFSAFASGSSFFNGGGDTGSGVPVKTTEHLP